METTILSAPKRRERSRLTLEVFKEKSIGSTKLNSIGGVMSDELLDESFLTSLTCPSIIVVITLSTEKAPYCKTDDCH